MHALGQAIKRLREERGWTQNELGEKVGLDGTNIARRENGTTKVKPAERYRFAEAFGMKVTQFDEAWRMFEVTRSKGGPGIPLINKAPAGEVQDYEEYGIDSGQGVEYLDAGDIRDDQAFALQIVGDSMAPTLREGDRVIFSYCDPYRDDGKLKPGRIACLRFVEGEGPVFRRVDDDAESSPAATSGCTVARFYPLGDDQVLLKKDNPAWAPAIVPREAIQNVAVAMERRTRLGD